jgi:hypothetical protein
VSAREQPHVGRRITVVYLGTRVQATIDRVSGDLREFEATTDEGAVVRFRLNQATARFTLEGASTGARVAFGLPDDDDDDDDDDEGTSPR